MRWRVMAERHPVEITLLVPAHWRAEGFGQPIEFQAVPVCEERYRVVPLNVTSCPTVAGAWLFSPLQLAAQLRTYKPDVLYVVAGELSPLLYQVMMLRPLCARHAKLSFFTWNNIGVQQHSWRGRFAWRMARAYTDWAIAGNREVEAVLRAAGYQKPIAVQTEIGVDETQFRPDPALRAAKRAELGLEGTVVAFSGRVTEEKGVFDLVHALRDVPGDWQLLVLGDGPRMGELKDRIGPISNRVRLMGFVPFDRMPDYVRLADILVLPSRTAVSSIGWKEQFGLVLAQAMASRVAVVGSSSGAIPEVIGDAGIVFPEGDVPALRDSLKLLMADPAMRDRLAEAGYQRCLARFSASSLADEAFHLFRRLIRGV